MVTDVQRLPTMLTAAAFRPVMSSGDGGDQRTNPVRAENNHLGTPNPKA